jgi:hypothetical protein
LPENRILLLKDCGRHKGKVQVLIKGYLVQIVVSAFGATDFPTSQGADPTETAQQLAKFVVNNNLDGVDLDWSVTSLMYICMLDLN